MNNKNSLEFSLRITITDGNEDRKMKFAVIFRRDENTYGNGYYMAVRGIEGTSMENLFDLRYERFNPMFAELSIADWAYKYWSGENGSWDIKSLSIKREK